jgi:hypothetical protein
MTGQLPNPNRTPKLSELWSDVTRVADLLKREEQLTAELRFVSNASYRRRVKIEEEISCIRRALRQLFSGPRGGPG